MYGLLKIGQMIERTFAPALDGDQIHLQRVMADARASISKRRLWLTETMTPHIDLRDATISRNNPTRDTGKINVGHHPSVLHGIRGFVNSEKYAPLPERVRDVRENQVVVTRKLVPQNNRPCVTTTLHASNIGSIPGTAVNRTTYT